MNSFAKMGLGLAAWLAAWGAAMPLAKACIDDGPPAPRSHQILRVDDNPWSGKMPPLLLATMDLMSVVLPGGSPEDWQVEIVETRPGLLRTLSPQELASVLNTKRLITTTKETSSKGSPLRHDLPRLHFGMLRSGESTLRIQRIQGQETFQLNLHIVDRVTNIVPKPTPAIPPGNGPVPLC